MPQIRPLADVIEDTIWDALQASSFNVSRAADALRIKRTTMESMISKYGLRKALKGARMLSERRPTSVEIEYGQSLESRAVKMLSEHSSAEAK